MKLTEMLSDEELKKMGLSNNEIRLIRLRNSYGRSAVKEAIFFLLYLLIPIIFLIIITA